MVKNLPAVQETHVQSLGQAYSLEKGMTTHSNIPAWRISWTEEPGRRQCMGSQRVRNDWAASSTVSFSNHWRCYIMTIKEQRSTFCSFFSLGTIYWRQSQLPNLNSGCHCSSFGIQTFSFSIIPNKYSFNERLRQFLPNVLHTCRIQEINKREERKRTHTLRKCIVLKSHVFSNVYNSVILLSLSSYCPYGK